MSVMDAVAGLWGGGQRDIEARCPVDDWTFHPRYTEGRCPLCGWVPEGTVPATGISLQAWMVRLVAVTVALSALVCWLTIVVYQRAG